MKMFKKMFGPKREDVTGEWKKQHSEELHNLYLSLNVYKGDQRR
jgi:hypothetical protein